jgi:hypothetical protein
MLSQHGSNRYTCHSILRSKTRYSLATHERFTEMKNVVIKHHDMKRTRDELSILDISAFE